MGKDFEVVQILNLTQKVSIGYSICVCSCVFPQAFCPNHGYCNILNGCSLILIFLVSEKTDKFSSYGDLW